MIVEGGREWLWEEGENGFGRRARMVVGGGDCGRGREGPE
jgi:hypothetical protein